jgi:N-acetylneuraminic acid mutarotase
MSGLDFFDSEASGNGSQRTLTFAERIAYQRAIEDVYWRHRIWPEETADPKPSLDSVMSNAQLEKKVEEYLRNSQALEDYWQRPLTAEQLQAELDRMAKNSRQPEVLRELFAALGNDPFMIAECLARPALAERSLTGWYAYDQRIHGELKQRAEAELQAHPTIEQVKQTSGTYTEIELIKSDSGESGVDHGGSHAVKLASGEWDETVQKLATTFSQSTAAERSTFGARRHVAAFEPSAGDESVPPAHSDISASSKEAAAEVYERIPVGKLSSLQEDEEHYYATVVIEKTDGHLKLGTIAWLKEPLESWLSRAENEVPAEPTTPNANYTLPEISAVGCVDDTWVPSSMNPPIGRWSHTAVWTGSEMIVWGGENNIALFGTGGRYNPSTDTWTATSIINNPTPRSGHTTVWTGTEMIVWGGFDGLHSVRSGKRYNPNTNTWRAMNTTNAPNGRQFHTAVWTGNKMIVWGGLDINGAREFNTGGRYNPTSDTWTGTSTTNTPAARHFHTAIWTGSEMVVWGGFDFGNNVSFDTGGRYNPSTNTWSVMSTAHAPFGRYAHTAVWTGSAMIVWGGSHLSYQNYQPGLNTGGRYNPTTNSWTATSATHAPGGRDLHTAVWTGSEMIVWGGFSSVEVNTGGRYAPGTNSWTPIGTANAPVVRWLHSAIWTGSEMIVWGGQWDHAVQTGGRYNPNTNSWVRTNHNAPTGRSRHSAIWTGSEMIVWGGEDGNYNHLMGVTNTGAQYHPSTDRWTRTSLSNAPSARSSHATVWTGTEMIVWGGFDYFGGLTTGGRYNPSANSWIATSTINAPSDLYGYYGYKAVWTGTRMIIWGAHSDIFDNLSNVGRRYHPGTNTWAGMSTSNAPTARTNYSAVWTGSEMIIWGGTNAHRTEYFNTGGRYNPSTNSWIRMSTLNAPAPRAHHTAVWTGRDMIVWGGYDDSRDLLNTGGRYHPATNSWTATSTVNAPAGREAHSAVWTGNEMIIWSGEPSPAAYGTGGRYNPLTNSWRATSTINAPSGRWIPTAVWTGSEMIVWGGHDPLFGRSDSGGVYCAQ